MGSPMSGGAAGGGGGTRSPAENEVEVWTHVNVLYRLEWRAGDGTYVAFDEGQSIKIETYYRRGDWGARVWGTKFPVGPGERGKCVIDSDDYRVHRRRRCGGGAMTRPWVTAGTTRLTRCGGSDRWQVRGRMEQRRQPLGPAI